jgi:hypothetical protein
MAWLLGLLVILLFLGLAILFTAAAFAIRRDFSERFERIGSRLREDAERILRHYPDGR